MEGKKKKKEEKDLELARLWKASDSIYLFLCYNQSINKDDAVGTRD